MSDGSPFLPSDLRQLIDADRKVPDPPEALRAGVAQSLDHELGLGGAMMGGPTTAPTVDNPHGQWDLSPSSGGSLHPSAIYGWKLLAGALLAVGAGGLALSLALRSSQPSAAPTTATSLATSPALIAPVAERVGLGALVPGSASDAVSSTGNVFSSGTGPRRASASPPSHARVSGDGLKEERTVLDAARAALVHRDAGAALAALRSHEQSFPRGQLVEERESMRVQALVMARDARAARAAGERFRRRFAHSVFLPAVERALENLP